MGTDTVVAITEPQLTTINRTINDCIHLEKINKNLQMDLVVSDSLTFYWRQVSLKKDTLIQLERLKFTEATRFNESLKESLKIEKSKRTKAIIGVGVGGTLLGVFLGVLLK